MAERSETQAANRQLVRRGAYLLLGFIIIVSVVAATSLWYYHGQREELKARVQTEMKTIADLKADTIASLLNRYHLYLNRTSRSPYFLAAAQELMTTGGADRERLMQERLSLELDAGGFVGVALLDDTGAPVVISDRGEGTLAVRAEDRAVITSGEATQSDVYQTELYLDDQDEATMDFIAPLIVSRDGSSRTIGYLLARIHAADELYPALLSWPVPSQTGETLLARLESKRVLALSELKYHRNSALRYSLPLDRASMEALGIRGRVVPGERADYRGVSVIAAPSKVPGTDWYVIAKTDSSEVFEPVQRTGALTLLIALTVILAAGALMVWAWARQSALDYRKLYEAEKGRAHAEEALAESEERLRLTLEATSDATWDLDMTTGVAVVNARYYTMLGYEVGEWPPDLDSWRRLLHPEDLAYAEESLGRLVSGASPKVSMEVRLRTKGGDWKWVLSRSKVVAWDKNGAAQRIVGTHVDLTERKQHEAELEIYRVHLEELVRARTTEVEEVKERVQDANEELAATNEELTAINMELDETVEELATANTDLTNKNEEIARAYQEIEVMNVDLATANRAKSDFLASMSHELRTPLNSILGFTGILLQGIVGPLNEEQRRQLDMVHKSGEHLLALVNDILDLEKIESGAANLELEACDIRNTATTLVESMRPLAEERGLTLTLDIGEIPETIRCDARRIEQVLFNLIGNAIKYTDEGGVSVEVTRSDGELRLAVTDTGPGIEPDQHEAIFDEFVQVTRQGAAKPQGTGLGLPVSQRLAHMHGGRIELESTPGKGSRFTLVLPIT